MSRRKSELADVLARKLCGRLPIENSRAVIFQGPGRLSATVPRAYTIRIMQNRRAERIACCESLTSPCPCPGHLSARNAYILGLIAVPCVPRPFLSPRPLRFTGKMRVPRADGNRSVNFAPLPTRSSDLLYIYIYVYCIYIYINCELCKV